VRCLFVHLGRNAVIRSNAVIAIIDWDTLWASDINQSYLERVKKNQRIQDISDGQPHSVVITADAVYLSTVSSATLKRRAENPHYLAWE
jgi:regulator of extracellular matrix RemA (YlzA/DUF370 family)